MSQIKKTTKSSINQTQSAIIKPAQDILLNFRNISNCKKSEKLLNDNNSLCKDLVETLFKIGQLTSIQDLFRHNGLRYKKLVNSRTNMHSIRIDKKYRLGIIPDDSNKGILHLYEVSNHYGD